MGNGCMPKGRPHHDTRSDSETRAGDAVLLLCDEFTCYSECCGGRNDGGGEAMVGVCNVVDWPQRADSAREAPTDRDWPALACCGVTSSASTIQAEALPPHLWPIPIEQQTRQACFRNK
jgi:hypothetical protein